MRDNSLSPTINTQPTINLGTCCGSDPAAGLPSWLDDGGTGIDTAFDYVQANKAKSQNEIAEILQRKGIK